MTPDPTYYELLGVEPTASQAEIKSAFRQQVKRNHPDQGGNSALFRMLEEAYETLVDPERRNDYDERFLAGRNSTPPHGVRMPEDEKDGSWDEPTGGWDDAFWEQEPPRASSNANREPPVFLAEENPTWLKKAVFLAVAAVLLGLAYFGHANTALLSGATIAQALFVVMVAWFLGSFFLRMAGWFLVIMAFVNARWHDASIPLFLGQFALGFVIWLCGQWFFTWRKGRWHSVIAYMVLSKLPTIFRPDRRWQEAGFL